MTPHDKRIMIITGITNGHTNDPRSTIINNDICDIRNKMKARYTIKRRYIAKKMAIATCPVISVGVISTFCRSVGKIL
jgi:hypothetical protein